MVATADVIDQESWSDKHHEFSVAYSRPIGARSARFRVRVPGQTITDGVCFFTYNARLYVWPKARMSDAVVQMLHVSGLIDDWQLRRFRAEGFVALNPTMSGN